MESISDPRSTQSQRSKPADGITVKVVKSGVWTLAGQVLPLIVSLAVTPFTIRLLGTDRYGLLSFLLLINTFLAFLDFGMSTAAVKLGSQAFAEDDEEKEKNLILTATKIAVMTSASAIFFLLLLSSWIVSHLNISSEFYAETLLSFRLALATLFFTITYSVVYAPQVIRLRMNLVVSINGGMRILGAISTLVIIYWGYGITGAMATLLAVSILTLFLHLFVSTRLLPGLFHPKEKRNYFPELLRFGSSMVLVSVGALLMNNSEKVMLPYLQPVEELGYYSVAFTLASMCTLLSAGITNTMLPALTQLLHTESFPELQGLYYRGIILILGLILPVFGGGLVGAETFFGYWGGSEYALNSTIPFYILLGGLVFLIPANLPFSLLISTGRTASLAKLYWFEFLPYLVIVYFFTVNYGIIGTAIAWSIRSTWVGLIYFVLVHRHFRQTLQFQLHIFRKGTIWFIGICILYIPLIPLTLLKLISPLFYCPLLYVFRSRSLDLLFSNIDPVRKKMDFL